MNAIHYIGLDVRMKTISYCIKTADGRIMQEGNLAATWPALHEWAKAQRVPWHGAMEATLFSAWIYDTLKPYAERLVMGHPARMKAITAGKKKSDSIDARTIADLLRCDLLPTCYVIAPGMRDLRIAEGDPRYYSKLARCGFVNTAPFGTLLSRQSR